MVSYGNKIKIQRDGYSTDTAGYSIQLVDTKIRHTVTQLDTVGYVRQREIQIYSGDLLQNA